MDVSLFETLLNESESTYIDFKLKEYPFDGTSDVIKSELLKDILAFANAWRRADAYILIGVKEVKGGRSEVVGITKHLEDASIQQFVNSKVQRPLNFSYSAFEYEGKQVGIINIPVQERPIYLINDFGKLKKHVVYIRRGSATDEAAPDEIAKMGVVPNIDLGQRIPSLMCEFSDPEKRKIYGNVIAITSKVIPLPDKIPNFKPQSGPLDFSIGYSGSPNRNYFRDLHKFYDFLYLLAPISFMVTNTGKTTAYNTRIEIKCSKHGVVISSKEDLPDPPKQYFNFIDPVSDRTTNQLIEQLGSKISIDCHEGVWDVSIEFGNIQPKAEAWQEEEIYIGSRITQNLDLEISVFADNLPEPIIFPFSINFIAEQQNLSLYDLEREHNDFIERHMKEFLEDNE